MPVRDCDVLPYLRLKTHMRPSDCLAVFEDGSKRPVFIYNNKFVIDTGTEFYEAEQFTGFQRFEKKPATFAPELPAPKVAEVIYKDDPVAGSESTQIDERWNSSHLYRRNMEREQPGNLIVEKAIGVEIANPHIRFYRVRCKCCQGQFAASQIDLITGRVKSCRDKKPIPAIGERPRTSAGLF